MPSLLDPENYVWNPTALPALLTALAMVALALYVVRQERASRESRSFAILALGITVWLCCFSGMYLAAGPDVAFLWARAAYVGIAFIPAAVYGFAVAITRRVAARRSVVGACWLLSAVFCAGMVGTDALLTELYRYPWGYYPRFRWLGAPFLVYFFTALLLALREFALDLRSLDEAQRQRSRRLLIAFAVAYLGSVDYFAAYGVALRPVGYLAVLVFIALAGFTIRRFRLVDFTPELAAHEILATMADPLVVCDRFGRVRLINREFTAVFGYGAADLEGAAVTVLAPAERLPEFADLLAHKTARGHELELAAASGERVPVELSISPLRIVRGVEVGSVVIARDARARQRAERSLRSNEERFRAVAETAGEGIVTADQGGRIVYLNPAAERIFGWPAELLQGQSLAVLMPERYRAAHLAGIARFGETGEGRVLGQTLELHGERRDGSAFPLELSLSAWRNSDGELFVTGILRDRTEPQRAAAALRASEETFRALAESAPAAVFICAGERIRYANRAAELMLGVAAADLEALPASHIAHTSERELLAGLLRKPAAAGARCELRLAGDRGALRWVDLTLAPLVHGGDEALILTAFDITESKLAVELAQASTRRLREILETVHLAVVMLDLAGTVTYGNDYLVELLGCAPEELLDSVWFERFVAADDRPALRSQFATRLSIGALAPHEEYDIVTCDGELRRIAWSHTVLRDPLGAITGLASIGADVTERRRAEEAMAHQATHDALTGLPNRTLFMDRLRVAFARAQRSGGRKIAVLFLDMDGFKAVNDSLGHLLGDQMLVQLARRFENCLRPGDTIGRLGGDEFTILLDDLTDSTEAADVAARINTALESPFDLEGHEVFCAASIGIAFGAARYSKAEDILRDANTALHSAKATGRGRQQVFDTPMHVHAVAQLQLESDLRRALERGEFRLFYQPIVRLEDGLLAGFEALLRWQHPERGLLLPFDFIILAEELGLVVPIGRWVLREACAQLQSWRERFGADDLQMTVNLSGRQLTQPGLLDLIAIVETSGVEPHHLKLEITESYIVENPQGAVATLERLRALGCSVCLDDFGTGYSSLSYLMRLPIDTLKVDRSFLIDLGRGSRTAEIVWSVIALAQRLRLEVIAEGVETEEQRALLVEMGCTLGQGFLFSPPAPAGVAEAFLATLGEPVSTRPAK